MGEKIVKKCCKRLLITVGMLMITMVLSGCGVLDTAAVKTGLKESPYYHLGDTWWDHGGIEEYYFNQIPSEMNEVYRE